MCKCSTRQSAAAGFWRGAALGDVAIHERRRRIEIYLQRMRRRRRAQPHPAQGLLRLPQDIVCERAGGMSEDDYKAGMRGDAYNAGMDRGDWESGKAVYDRKQAILGTGASAGGGAGGCALIAMLPFLPIFYPLAGVGAFGTIYLLDPFLRDIGTPELLRLALGLVVGVMGFLAGIWVERRGSQFFLYRVARFVLRLGFITGFVALLSSGQLTNRYVGSEPNLEDIVVGVPIALLACWMLRKVDDRFGLGPRPRRVPAEPSAT
jgi:hypothetical protein